MRTSLAQDSGPSDGSAEMSDWDDQEHLNGRVAVGL